MDSGALSPTTTTTPTTTEASAAVDAVINLDTKTKETTTTMMQQQQQQQQQTQKLRKLVRRNASDKLKLIQMVHDNPILWDSRLPNFKGAEEEKTRAWEFIGKEFNAPGRRVARAFKSLRESYRRELAHVKVMGSEFKPKWSLYEAMDFLRDVIRERKGGSHMVDHSAAAAAGLNLSALSHHNLSHNNNNNNNNNNNHHTLNKCGLKLNSLSSSFNDSALNLSSRSSLNLSQDDYYYFVKPEMDLSYSGEGLGKAAGGGGGGGGQPQTPSLAHHHQQQQQQPHHHVQPSNGGHQQPQQHHDTRVSSTRNDTSSSQNHAFDDMDASSLRSGDEASVRNAGLSQHGSDEVEELEAIDADFPYPLILDNSNSPLGGASNGHAPGGGKRRRKADDGDGGDDGEEDDDDAYGGQMMQQHRHLRQQSALEMPPPQTVREVLNSKFCGFISAKLNSMEDTEADNLMNKILMLLVQTQGNALQSQDTK